MSAGKDEDGLGPCRITVLPDEKVGEPGGEGEHPEESY